MENKCICNNCRLKIGDYCFCGDNPEQLTDNIITECDYFFDGDDASYYEFIDGYTHCNKLKRIELHKQIKALNEKIKELEHQLENKNNEIM